MQVKSLDPGFTDIIVHPQFGKAQKGVRPFSLALPDLAIVILRCHSIRLGHIPTIAKSRHLHYIYIYYYDYVYIQRPDLILYMSYDKLYMTHDI